MSTVEENGEEGVMLPYQGTQNRSQIVIAEEWSACMGKASQVKQERQKIVDLLELSYRHMGVPCTSQPTFVYLRISTTKKVM